MGFLRRRRAYKQIEMEGGIPFADDFARADGALGNGWMGATWTIDAGSAKATPTKTQRLTDPGVENWASATNLTSYTENLAGTSTVNREGTVIHGGSYAARLDVDASGSGVSITQQPAGLTAGFVEALGYLKSDPTAKQGRLMFAGNTLTLTDTYTLYRDTIWLASGIALGFTRHSASEANAKLYGDDFEFNTMPLADTLAGRTYSRSTVHVGGKCTIVAGALAGVVCCLDSLTTPKYGVFAWHNGATGRCHLAKLVNGTMTVSVNSAAAYAAGGVVEIRHDPLGTFKLYYQGVQVGATQDYSAETGIINNRIHGMFSTHLDNRIDDFFVQAP